MVDNQGRASRVLPFPLKNPLVIKGTTSVGTVTNITPDMFPVDPDERINVSLNVSLNEYVTLASAIDIGRDIGYGEETNEVWWIWVRALMEATGMTCADVADCIENDADVLNALLQQLSANGYIQSPNVANPANVTMSPSASAANLLSASFSCEDASMMAVARAVIREFNEASEDFFEALELQTNLVEAANIATDGIPVAGTINNFTELLDWLIQTMREDYQASYNQEVEDILACALFCLMRVDCELTYDMLIAMYADFADPSVAFPDTSSFQNIADWALQLTLTIGVGVVATFHWILAQAMRFGDGTVFQMAGLTNLQNIIQQAETWQDNTFDDCDCITPPDPETYWMIVNDLSLGLNQWRAKFGTVQADGIMSATSGNNTLFQCGIPDFGAQYTIKAVSFIWQGRGYTGLSTDSASFALYSAINYVTLVANTVSVTGINGDSNEFSRFGTNLTVNNIRSGYATSNNGLPQVYPTNFCKIYKVAIYGLCNGTVKPPGSQYVAALPATIDDIPF
jgi:hypothetical protein